MACAGGHGQTGQLRFVLTLGTSYDLPLTRGVLNIVHGSRDVVNRICDHPDIKAVSFVGSDQAGRYIYQVGASGAGPGEVAVEMVGCPTWPT